MRIVIKTIDERVSDYMRVSLVMDEDGMKYTVFDERFGEKGEEQLLNIEVPQACRREIRRRYIPNVDGKTGTLSKYQALSPLLENFICECWRMILEQEPQLLT